MQKILKSIAVSAAALAAAGLFSLPAAAAETIKIGSFLAATGPAAFLGDPEMKTLKLYVEKINESGGVLGKKVELIAYDSAGSAKSALSFVKRLIQQDKVDIIVGGTTTGETMAVIPEVQKAGMPFISLAGADVIIKPVKKWVFKTPHTDRLAVDKVFRYAKARGVKNFGIIAGSGGFDKSCRANAHDLAPQYGITIVADETHGKSDTDMTPQLTKIKNAPGLQAVLGCGFGAPTSIVTKNYRQLGISAPLFFNHGVASKGYIKGSAGAAEGVKLPAAALIVAEQLPGDHPQKAVALAYRKAYTERYKEDISTFGGHAYDGLFLAVNAIQRAGTTDKAKVLAALESTENFVGVDGIFNMSPTDHLGLGESSLVMVEVNNGGWKLLK